MTVLLLLLAGGLFYLISSLRITIAEIGYGATIAVGGTNINQSVDIGAPEMELPEVKITNNQSPNAAQEYLPGLIEPGTITVRFIYNSGDFGTVSNQLLTRTIDSWIVTWADGSTFVCDGFVKSLKKSSPLEEAETFEATVKLTGLPTFTG